MFELLKRIKIINIVGNVKFVLLSAVNYFHKIFQLRYLTGFRPPLVIFKFLLYLVILYCLDKITLSLEKALELYCNCIFTFYLNKFPGCSIYF